MDISVYRDEESDKAVIFAGVEGKVAKFEVQGRRIGEEASPPPKISVERDFGDGTGSKEKIEKNNYLLAAFYEIVSLWEKPHQQMEISSFCRACTAKVDSLPGSKI